MNVISSDSGIATETATVYVLTQPGWTPRPSTGLTYRIDSILSADVTSGVESGSVH